MQEHCDFGEQVAGADSQIWPGLTVRPLEDRTVAVDVNVSTAVYLDARLPENGGSD